MRNNGPFENDFDVPFTSLSTNMIHGGIAHNTIPADCEFTFEFRHLPSVEPAELNKKIQHYLQTYLQPKMQQEYQQAKLELDHIAVAPSFSSQPDNEILSLARSLLSDQKIRKVAYATEAGLFQQTAIPTIVCGPGNIEQAHRANEYIELSQLKKCENFLRKITQQFCGAE
ncbi:MAG: acetylornithine deacetylase [uncultured bacterium]|nr:MAG: acetylornithine deacetylase [uncultured bacterium]